MPGRNPEGPSIVNLERLMFLADGVFAITMTLLVLDLRPPEVEASQLAQALYDMLPRLAVYLIAFYTIANHWLIHQRNFRLINEEDEVLTWLTFATLLFITLLPASTAIVGRYPLEKLAVACFSVNSFLLALVTWLFWVYARKHKDRFAVGVDPHRLDRTADVWMYICAGGLASIALGWLNVLSPYAIWTVWPYVISAWITRPHQRLD
jgi:uncharacterized membrane protein